MHHQQLPASTQPASQPPTYEPRRPPPAPHLVQRDPRVLQHLRDGGPVARGALQRPLDEVALLLAHFGGVVDLVGSGC